MKRCIAKIPFNKIQKIEICLNFQKKSLAAIKAESGCDYIINAGLFNMAAFTPVGGLTVDGRIHSKGGDPWGYAFVQSGIELSYNNSAGRPNFIGGYPCLIKDGQRFFAGTPKGLEGERGRSAMGLTGDSLVLLCVSDVADKTDYTLEELCADLLKEGCLNAINLDGGGSSQCDFSGDRIPSSRAVHNYICVWTIKEAMPAMDTFTNGAIRTPVYETTACQKQIGSLDPHEQCALLYKDSDFAVVMYFITNKIERKVGFVRR